MANSVKNIDKTEQKFQHNSKYKTGCDVNGKREQ